MDLNSNDLNLVQNPDTVLKSNDLASFILIHWMKEDYRKNYQILLMKKKQIFLMQEVLLIEWVVLQKNLQIGQKNIFLK